MLSQLLMTDVDTRTPAQIREHYEVERALANQLRSATREERRSLYSSVYDELFRRVPDHPQLARKADSQSSAREVARKMKLVGRYLHGDSVFLEVGPGDCAFAFEVAKRVRKVYAVDVSAEIARIAGAPANFELIISDGCTIPVPDQSVTIAYSNQLMEHLHPDDALAQLQNIYRALSPGGIYICITPNRIAGPHDVSQHFDEVATGFHLKEYSYSELLQLLSRVGFASTAGYVGGRGIYARSPVRLLLAGERLLANLPPSSRKRIARSILGRAFLGMNVVASKTG